MKKVLTQIYIEKHQKDWLKKEAKKRKLTLAGLFRYYIRYFMTDPKNK